MSARVSPGGVADDDGRGQPPTRFVRSEERSYVLDIAVRA
jgi:hypothetical protein